MDKDRRNAERLLSLLERLRPQLMGPAFRRLHDLELSPSHIRMLRALHSGESLAMKDLADQLCIKPPSVTSLTRRLVATGLVGRQAHAEDSRVVLIGLTEAGRALHRELHEEQLANMARLLARLSPAEQRTFLDLLERATAEQG
ncbi:MAG TPA: MarR family transcriptional regulator [Chloroflexaceae bacterium]|nr:MarR family transcriptional regulator [Chloroflexaceae bacterium]